MFVTGVIAMLLVIFISINYDADCNDCDHDHDANHDKKNEKGPEDLLNNHGNLDTLLLVHDVRSLPAW